MLVFAVETRRLPPQAPTTTDRLPIMHHFIDRKTRQNFFFAVSNLTSFVLVLVSCVLCHPHQQRHRSLLQQQCCECSCCGIDTSAFLSFRNKAELGVAISAVASRVNLPAALFEIEQTYGPMKCWDVSRVTDMSHLFMYNSWQDSLAGLECWDVSSVTDMSFMFIFTELTAVPDLSKWDVSSVTNMQKMLAYTNL